MIPYRFHLSTSYRFIFTLRHKPCELTKGIFHHHQKCLRNCESCYTGRRWRRWRYVGVKKRVDEMKWMKERLLVINWIKVTCTIIGALSSQRRFHFICGFRVVCGFRAGWVGKFSLLLFFKNKHHQQLYQQSGISHIHALLLSCF